MLRKIVLSLFPGIDILGRGFERAGYCVVRGPDPALGTGDIRDFNATPGFDGVIGGSPCQDFSKARRCPPSGEGRELLQVFRQIVTISQPRWWLLENVPSVPDVTIDGYSHQRIDLRACEFGLPQSRLRHFQFGHLLSYPLIIPRGARVPEMEPCCMASEANRPHRRSFPEFCQLQGLPSNFDVPYFTRGAKYRAVGNAVPLPMAEAIAKSITDILPNSSFIRVCECGCARPVEGKHRYALAACRKRAERRRNQVQRPLF